MKAFDDALERLFDFVAARASERGILVLAVVVYGGIGLVLPLGLGWPVLWLVTANIVGTTFAFAFLATWIATRVQESRRRNLLEWTTDLRRLDAAEFEWLVGEVFRREGWKVEETGGHGEADGGIDLRIGRGKDRRLVQCKRWTAWQVGVDEVRALGGTLAREGMPASSGVLVTLSDFSPAARHEAKQMGMLLLDRVDLYARVEKVRRPERCPVCDSAMLLDRSPFGWWFRCTRPGCGGKRDLGRDPAHAIELLTQPPDSRSG